MGHKPNIARLVGMFYRSCYARVVDKIVLPQHLTPLEISRLLTSNISLTALCSDNALSSCHRQRRVIAIQPDRAYLRVVS